MFAPTNLNIGRSPSSSVRRYSIESDAMQGEKLRWAKTEWSFRMQVVLNHFNDCIKLAQTI
jgi:hypothetical protein